MADVLDLSGKRVEVPHGLLPVADIVEKLERLLAQAKRGDIRALGIVAVRAGCTVSTQFSLGPDANNHELMAGITYLQHRYAVNVCDGPTVIAEDQ
jgi:hypothetical protein